MIILASIVYVICIAYIGFYVSTVLYLLLGSWYLNEKGFTLRTLVFSLVFGVGVSVVLYATFTAFLQVENRLFPWLMARRQIPGGGVSQGT